MSVQFHYAARSDVGLTRSNNQDSGYAGPHLLVLADGMGGPAGGDIASSVAVAHLVPLDDDVHPAEDLLELLRDSVAAAHDELIDRSEQDPDLQGLGTTCIALLRSGNKLGMIHIGDSRAYLLRDGALTQVTADHTYVQHLVDTGRITAEEAEFHPNRNMILKALGDSDGEVALDESMREARPGDRWLLCSDGLSGLVAHETIQETLELFPEPGECADQLVDLALRAGGTDNVTVVVAEIVTTGERPRAGAISAVPQIVGAAANKSFATSRAAAGSHTSAAGKAAKLTPKGGNTEPEEPPARKRRRVGGLVGLALIVLLAAGGLFGGYLWTQTQYYVHSDNGFVAIYRGIPQSIGGLHLSEVYERTDVKVAALSGLAQSRLVNPITRGSLAGAKDVVNNLRTEIVVPSEPREVGKSRESGNRPTPLPTPPGPTPPAPTTFPNPAVPPPIPIPTQPSAETQ